MEAHARLGERGEALRQYDLLRAVLARELGVAPLPETEALRMAILGGTFDRSAPVEPADEARRAPAAALARRPGVAAPRFVGRKAELATLDAALAAAVAGNARVVLLTGDVGLGKSRLWREWSAALPGGCVALEARCLEATQALPFAPLVELFGSHAGNQRLFRPGSPVAGVWLAEVARLLPALRHDCPIAGSRRPATRRGAPATFRGARSVPVRVGRPAAGHLRGRCALGRRRDAGLAGLPCPSHGRPVVAAGGGVSP